MQIAAPCLFCTGDGKLVRLQPPLSEKGVVSLPQPAANFRRYRRRRSHPMIDTTASSSVVPS
jgi:hypothetical protein